MFFVECHHPVTACSDPLMLNVDGGKFVTSLLELTGAARLSPCQVQRALRRLGRAHLIRWERGPGCGHRSQITILGRSPNIVVNPAQTGSRGRFPSSTPSTPKPMQSTPPEVIHSPAKLTEARHRIERENRNVSPYARYPTPRETKTSHTGKVASALPLGPRALAWAMAQVRNDLRTRPSINPERRGAILGAWRGAAPGSGAREVRTRGELSCLVGFILARLEERRSLGLELGAARRWAEWCVREGLRRVEEERVTQEKAARFLAGLRREADEARRAWAAVSREGSTLAFYQALPPKPLATPGRRRLQGLGQSLAQRRSPRVASSRISQNLFSNLAQKGAVGQSFSGCERPRRLPSPARARRRFSSRARTTTPSRIIFGGLASLYPPPGPFEPRGTQPSSGAGGPGARRPRVGPLAVPGLGRTGISQGPWREERGI
ncbi:MAG: hypothetical protein QXQ66_06985 [Candidatus Hadarchaeum sp.]